MRGKGITNMLQVVQDLKNGGMCSVLRSKTMLVRVQQTMGVPYYLLYPRSDHTRPKFANNLKEGDETDLV
jgi:hypothetical protein